FHRSSCGGLFIFEQAFCLEQGTFFPLLFFFNYHSSNLKISQNHSMIYGLHNLFSGFLEQEGNPFRKPLWCNICHICFIQVIIKIYESWQLTYQIKVVKQLLHNLSEIGADTNSYFLSSQSTPIRLTHILKILSTRL
ncbi:MAG TPA: hypothetical protein PLQ17_02360, partial [Saprospiraceae bacterium]|nr:hypothetical protein [Saprospiraceae bacterium]